MRKSSGGSDLLALGLGLFIIFPFILFGWAFTGDKEWKRIVGGIFVVVWVFSLIFGGNS